MDELLDRRQAAAARAQQSLRKALAALLVTLSTGVTARPEIKEKTV